MIYRNTKTGVIIDSPCVISGGDWILEEDIIKDPIVEDEDDEDEEEETETDEETTDFESMTVAELRDFATVNKIDLGDAKKKDDIVAVLSSTK